jgi:hypothetical protein
MMKRKWNIWEEKREEKKRRRKEQRQTERLKLENRSVWKREKTNRQTRIREERRGEETNGHTKIKLFILAALPASVTGVYRCTLGSKIPVTMYFLIPQGTKVLWVSSR